ncbi:MAG: hypothetical protein O2973_12950 [Gemmatimonadetes bacterium]|nr:hypothetical protein [Gemmatimonadota bacterium]
MKRPHRRVGTVAAAWLFVLLTAELMLGGPFGSVFLGMNIRYVLWGVTAAVSFPEVALAGTGSRLCRGWVCFALTLMVVWGFVVPISTGGSLDAAFQDSRPLLASVVVGAASCAVRYFGLGRLLTIVAWISVVPTVAICSSWTWQTAFGDGSPAEWLTLWLRGSEEWRSGVYIGPMPGGSYRVMWVFVMFLPFVVLSRTYSRWFFMWVALTGYAAACSGTRAIMVAWGVSLACVVVLRWGFRGIVASAAVAAIGVCSYAEIEGFRGLSFADLSDENDPRRLQASALLEAWAAAPLIGHGFGSAVNVVRSDTAPFSYELTYLALLCKVGVIGAAMIVTGAVGLATKCARLTRTQQALAATSAGCFLLITATNPYLLNLFGIWLASLLVAVLDAIPRKHRARR